MEGPFETAEPNRPRDDALDWHAVMADIEGVAEDARSGAESCMGGGFGMQQQPQQRQLEQEQHKRKLPELTQEQLACARGRVLSLLGDYTAIKLHIDYNPHELESLRQICATEPDHL